MVVERNTRSHASHRYQIASAPNWLIRSLPHFGHTCAILADTTARVIPLVTAQILSGPLNACPAVTAFGPISDKIDRTTVFKSRCGCGFLSVPENGSRGK